MECIRFKSYEKGFLQGFADLYVTKWGLEIKGIGLYMKNGKRWISFPSQKFENCNGETSYSPYIKFRERDHMDKFTESAKKAIDKWCEENQPKTREKEEVPDNSPAPF